MPALPDIAAAPDAVASAGSGEGTASPLPAAILDAARAILLDDGYRALSMRRLAQRIGYSPTTLYLHYAGKDDILHALIDEGFERLNAALDAADDAVGGDGAASPLARLDARARAYVDFGRDNPERYEVMFLVHPRHMERYPAALYRRARRSLDGFAGLLREAGRAGLLAVADADLAASAVWAQLHGLVALVLTRRLDVRHAPDALADAVVSGIVRGLPRPAAS